MTGWPEIFGFFFLIMLYDNIIMLSQSYVYSVKDTFIKNMNIYSFYKMDWWNQNVMLTQSLSTTAKWLGQLCPKCSVVPNHVQLVAVIPQTTIRMGLNLNSSNIKEGDGVYFECEVNSNPPPKRITWRHNVSDTLSNNKIKSFLEERLDSMWKWNGVGSCVFSFWGVWYKVLTVSPKLKETRV